MALGTSEWLALFSYATAAELRTLVEDEGAAALYFATRRAAAGSGG